MAGAISYYLDNADLIEPLYICIEGPDAVGKSTLVKYLVSVFEGVGANVGLMRAPSLFRKELYSDKYSPFQKAIMFLTDAIVTYENFRDFDIIIADRCALHSTRVYQLPYFETLNEITRYADMLKCVPMPYLSFFIDAEDPFREKDDTVFEQENDWYEIRDRYRNIQDNLVSTIGANLSTEEQAEKVLGQIMINL
jgi:thymidylate kinase